MEIVKRIIKEVKVYPQAINVVTNVEIIKRDFHLIKSLIFAANVVMKNVEKLRRNYGRKCKIVPTQPFAVVVLKTMWVRCGKEKQIYLVYFYERGHWRYFTFANEEEVKDFIQSNVEHMIW